MVHDRGGGGEVWEPIKNKLWVCICVNCVFFLRQDLWTYYSLLWIVKQVCENWLRTTVLKNYQNLRVLEGKSIKSCSLFLSTHRMPWTRVMTIIFINPHNNLIIQITKKSRDKFVHSFIHSLFAENQLHLGYYSWHPWKKHTKNSFPCGAFTPVKGKRDKKLKEQTVICTVMKIKGIS